MKQLLVVEDEPDIQELLQNFLEAAGYGVTLAGDGVEAITRFQQKQYDLVLLDVMLPKIDGYGVCELIRHTSTVPVVMLTALDDEAHQLQGFDLKIDDYITKPFSMPILLRKLEAVLRRAGGQSAGERQLLVYQKLTLDLDGYQAYVDGKPVELTHREFEVLQLLLRNQGRVLTRQMLLNQLWDFDFLGDERVIDTHIKNLRKKLQLNYIETIRGVGYRVEQLSKA